MFTVTLDKVKKEWDKCDAMSTLEVQSFFLKDGNEKVVEKKPSDWEWSNAERRGSCCYQIFGSGTLSNSILFS